VHVDLVALDGDRSRRRLGTGYAGQQASGQRDRCGGGVEDGEVGWVYGIF